MPSTISKVVSEVLLSPTCITPFLPTLSIASAMIDPILESLLAEIVAICFTSSLVFTSRLKSRNFSITAVVALSIPLFNSIGLTPELIAFNPSLYMNDANTVAVVVPSPACLAALIETSLIT